MLLLFAHGLIAGPHIAGPLFAGLRPIRKHHCGHHSCDLILHNFFPNRSWINVVLKLHLLEIPPTDLLELGWAIRTSNHMGGLAKKDHGMAHGGPKVMKDQVLMDPSVRELEPTSPVVLIGRIKILGLYVINWNQFSHEFS